MFPNIFVLVSGFYFDQELGQNGETGEKTAPKRKKEVDECATDGTETAKKPKTEAVSNTRQPVPDDVSPKSEFGPITPTSQKCQYYSLSGRAQVGLSVTKGWPRIFVRQVSATSWHSTQAVSMIEREFRDLIDKFEYIDNFLLNDKVSVTIELAGDDKVVKISKDSDFTKVSIKRKFGDRLKGVTISVPQYEYLKDLAPKLMDKITVMKGFKEAEPTDCEEETDLKKEETIDGCFQKVIAYKIEQMLKEPRFFCRDHVDEDHVCTKPDSWDWTLLCVHYPGTTKLVVPALSNIRQVH